MTKLNQINICYLPNDLSLKLPGDRRRFVFFARYMKISYETKMQDNYYQLIYCTYGNNLSKIFIKRQESAINYGAANYKYKLKDALKNLNITTKQIPDTYYTFMLDLAVDENDLITVPEFYEYLEHRFEYKYITTPYKATNELETVSYTFNIAHGLYKGRVQNIYLTKKFGELLDTYSYENTSRFISSYMSTVYQKEYRNYIDKKLEKARLRN